MKKIPNPKPLDPKKYIKIKDKRPKKKAMKHLEDDRIKYDREEYDDFSRTYETNE